MRRAFLLLIGMLCLMSMSITSAQTDPVMVIDTPPPAVSYVGDTFTVEFSCRDPQTNEVIIMENGTDFMNIYRASNDELVSISGGIHEGSSPAQVSRTITNLDPDFYYLRLGFSGCDPINSNTFEIRATSTLSFTLQPTSNYTTLQTSVRVQHSQNTEGVEVTLTLYDNTSGLAVDRQFPTLVTDFNGTAGLYGILSWDGGEYYFVASAEGLADVQSDVFTKIQPVWSIDSPPPPLLYTDETFVVEFSCRDPQTNVIVDWDGGVKQWDLYLADTDELVSSSGIGIVGGTVPAQMTYTIQNLEPELYYVKVSMTGCGEVITNDFEIRERPVSLDATASCAGPDLVVDIVDGDGPFDIIASAGVNTPLIGVSTGTHVITGPGTWTNVRVVEQSDDFETLVLGDFTCNAPTNTSTATPTPTNTATNTASPTYTPTVTPTATNTPIPPTYTSTETPGPVALNASAACQGPDLVVTIAQGDDPFDISASKGINVPVNGVSVGQTVIGGPDKWTDLTVTEAGGDLESINLGMFKCRPDDRPVPQSPQHRATVTTSNPTFRWTGIQDANNYRVFLFDNKVAADRTVDIRQNSGGPTQLTLSTALDPGRYFWRVRARVNSVWGYWSTRSTLFVG